MHIRHYVCRLAVDARRQMHPWVNHNMEHVANNTWYRFNKSMSLISSLAIIINLYFSKFCLELQYSIFWCFFDIQFNIIFGLTEPETESLRFQRPIYHLSTRLLQSKYLFLLLLNHLFIVISQSCNLINLNRFRALLNQSHFPRFFLISVF